ncbi:hypothetical protein [Variovorax sp. WS11]|nr:hypothetical protein [Variovorax sp. WS11]NDZ16984.1 hypothetical protein [Variovorax sp. WS11]
MEASTSVGRHAKPAERRRQLHQICDIVLTKESMNGNFFRIGQFTAAMV